MTILYVLIGTIFMNNEPYMSFKSIAPSQIKCELAGNKLEKEILELTEGKGYVKWKCEALGKT